MGYKSRDEIITEALELAGDPGLSARAVEWLRAWLDRTYRQTSWKFLIKRLVHQLNAGASSVSINDEDGDILYRVHAVRKAGLFEPNYRGFSGDARLIGTDELWPDEDPLAWDPSNRGVPSKMLVEQVMPGDRAVITFAPSLDRNFSLLLELHTLPDLSDAVFTENYIPEYPTDETMIQAVFVKALLHRDDPRADVQLRVLKSLEEEDKVIHTPRKKRMQLSRARFRR